MKANKGCTNENCSDFKRILYSNDVSVCPTCKQPLTHVCVTCFTPLQDHRRKYCIDCENKRKQKNKQKLTTAKNVSVGTVKTVYTSGKFIRSSMNLAKNIAGDVAMISKGVIALAKLFSKKDD